MFTHSRALPIGEDIAICAITGEILCGIDRLPAGRRRDQLLVQATALLAAIKCLAVNSEAADHYARFKCSRENAWTSVRRE
jgi:predicted nucleic acid-binding protein